MSKARQLAQKPSQPTGRKNLLINGAFQVHERTDSNVTGATTSGYKYHDRWRVFINTAGTWEIGDEANETTPSLPDGFSNAARIECTTANASLAAGANIHFHQIIEGQNCQSLQKGTSTALPITVSFWVRSNKTGKFVLEAYQPDNTARHIVSNYTINTADTWEYKKITFAGDTDTDGKIDNDNGAGLGLYWWLGGGSDYSSGTQATSWTDYNVNDILPSDHVNLADTVNNNWSITGVQVEIGSVATAFDYESIQETLEMCQRYYQRITADGDTSQDLVLGQYSTDQAYASYPLLKKMRAAPSTRTIDITNAFNSNRNIFSSGNTTISAISSTQSTLRLNASTFTNAVAGDPCLAYVDNITADAELT